MGWVMEGYHSYQPYRQSMGAAVEAHQAFTLTPVERQPRPVMVVAVEQRFRDMPV